MKKIGIIGQFIQCFFWLLRYLPPQVFIEPRPQHQNRIQGLTTGEREKAINRRMRIVDLIVISYSAIYILIFIFILPLNHSHCLKCLVLVILTLRLIDIIQVNINIVLFDRLRIKQPDPYIYSAIRSIILVSYNFLEIAIIFGFYYALIRPENLVCHISSTLDNFYFSFISQLTIGYGDIYINRVLQIFWLLCKEQSDFSLSY